MFGIMFKVEYIRHSIIQAQGWARIKMCLHEWKKSLVALMTPGDSAGLTMFPFFEVPVSCVE